MPDSDVYELYQRGMALLAAGSNHAAAEVLMRARRVEPTRASIRVGLGRALFNARRFHEALEEFSAAVELNPADDYAHYGVGLSSQRLGDALMATRHLKLAVAMAPENDAYGRALARQRSISPPE